jgi:hypothetical protein
MIATNTGSTSHMRFLLPFKISTSSVVNPTHKGSKGEVNGASVPKMGI